MIFNLLMMFFSAVAGFLVCDIFRLRRQIKALKLLDPILKNDVTESGLAYCKGFMASLKATKPFYEERL